MWHKFQQQFLGDQHLEEGSEHVRTCRVAIARSTGLWGRLRKQKSLEENMKSISSFTLSAVMASILAACGGGGGGGAQSSAPGPVATSPAPAPIPPIIYSVGDKNAGGISYSAGDGAVLDKLAVDRVSTPAIGIPDRVNTGIFNRYPDDATTSNLTKRAAITAMSAWYTSLLSITNANLPKSNAEAQLIMSSPARIAAYCKMQLALTDSELEDVSLQVFFMNIYDKAKARRFLEIQELAGPVDFFSNCP